MITVKYIIYVFILSSFLIGEKYNPTTGELIQDSTQFKLKFDPYTGILIQEDQNSFNVFDTVNIKKKIKIDKEILYDPITGNEILSKSIGLEQKSNIIQNQFSNEDIVKLAKVNAKTDFNGFFWSVGGGPFSLWLSMISSLLTLSIDDSGTLFIPTLIGTTYGIPDILSKKKVKLSRYDKKFAEENFSSRENLIYFSEYEKEVQDLRLASIRKGQFGLIGGLFVLMMISL